MESTALINSLLVVFDKAQLLSGTSPTLGTFALPAATYGYYLQPAIMYDTNTSAMYLVMSANPSTGNGNGIIRMYSLGGSVSSPTLSLVGSPQAAAWTNKFAFDKGKQLGIDTNINLGDSRMNQVVFRDGSIWCAHTICLPAITPTHSLIQWWQLATNATITQRGFIEDPTTVTNYAYPSIAVNRFGDVLVGFSSFSTNQYGSASYAFRSPIDPNRLLK